jgi:CDGSH-type Zn-finger protein
MAKNKITIVKNGPYRVSGDIPLRKEIAVVPESDREKHLFGGAPETWVEGAAYPPKPAYSLCRCGASKAKPFCDGSHMRIAFDGTETADRTPFIQKAERFEGPAVDLLDVPKLCSGARFCEPEGGSWNLVKKSDDAAAKQTLIRQAGNCPSGRLVAMDKSTGKPVEPEYDQSISLTEDPQVGMSGPLWVKGGIPVESSDGSTYEIMNRMTLCRCGHSQNKPLCDGAHFRTGFNDGDASLSTGGQ